MMIDKEVTQLPYDPPHFNFSYNACSIKTLNDDRGQLQFNSGHDGVGVVDGSFGGDGIYPVYADIDEDGVTRSITIMFNN